MRYYAYDTDTTFAFKNNIPYPITSVAVVTTNDDELWSTEGTDLFKNAQHGGITTPEDQAAFFEGRTDPAKGPLFDGVKNKVIEAALKEGIVITGFGDADAERTKITLNAKSEEIDNAVGIKIIYNDKEKHPAEPTKTYTEDTAADAYGWADSVKFSLKDSSGVLTVSGGDISEKDGALVELEGTAVYEAVLAAKPDGISGTVTLVAELIDDDGYIVVANNAVVRMNTTVNFHAEPGSDSGTQPVSLNVSYLAGSHSDPEKNAWNGIDLYDGQNDDEGKTSNPGPGTAGKAKVSSISQTSFTAGNFEDQSAEITIKGAAPNVWVYIAQKDAKTLFPGEDGVKKVRVIYLTRQNIAQYGIPFRVTSFERGEDTKNAESKLTLTFNGAKTAFKSFPITVAAQNAAMKSPATKTFKLNVQYITNRSVYLSHTVDTLITAGILYREKIFIVAVI